MRTPTSASFVSSRENAADGAAFSLARLPASAVALACAISFAALNVTAQAPVSDRSTPPAASAGKPAATSAVGASAPAAAPAATPTTISAPAKMFVTIGDKPSVMFDAPSNKANKIFIINPLTPLEVLVKLDKLTKVRDADGTVGWVENATLGERRHVQVSTPTADVRASPAAAAPLVFDAQRGVALEVTGAATEGWLPVKHRDGQSGYVRLNQVWGD